MLAKVQKWGNSQGLRLSRRVLEDVQISVGEEVDVVVRDGTIVVAPVKRVRGRYSLRRLVARIPKEYRVKELDWGKPVGKEAW
ncbi:MAG: transcriptional regulator/antitoxin, MazE [Deltaproteobacteria bacterium RBG_16_55_12]|jgi:antitoxin MazE|nr:MAG: transcriptional regulator/antitoxin, MazE [Deltaproteobacteria bacterium RBG_16_55_12]